MSGGGMDGGMEDQDRAARTLGSRAAEPATDYQAVGSMSVLDIRPQPGQPREYHFPTVRREVLPSGMTVVTAHLPGRPLLAAQLLLEGGAVSEPPDVAGATVLAARALPEGTRRRDAIALVEAAERLGTSLHAEAGWETLGASLSVSRRHFAEALPLLAEMVLEPSFPAQEVERLRAERLNQLLQARAEPRSRAERAFTETIYAGTSPFARPLGGDERTVPRLNRATLVERHAQLADPARATLVVAGDLSGLSVARLAEAAFGGWHATGSDAAGRAVDDSPNPRGRTVVVVDRPGSPQSEVRIGHVGLQRAIPDYHAVVVMSAILGGLFNSRLQRLLREERGYTYGIGASFDFRRGRGPFAVRTAVHTEVTGPAVAAILGELARMRAEAVSSDELEAARDYLVGVFPLRFESASQVAGAIAGLVALGLPDDELDRYRPAIAGVTVHEVLRAAQHVDPAAASIVIVGDAAQIEPGLRAAGVEAIEVLREPIAAAE